MAKMKSLTLNDVKYEMEDANAIHAPTTATIGQTIVVKAVDENGAPTEWEAVDFPEVSGGESGSGAGIIDVVELPTEDIDENVFYRLIIGKFVSNYYYNIDGWTCYCVNGLPSIGEPVSIDMVNITGYYNAQDGEVYGYADSNISAVGGIPVGWYPINVLAQAFEVSWGGVITDADDVDDSAKLLLGYDYYAYKNEWIKHIFAYEKHPKFDITWDGVIGDKFALDLTPLGYTDCYYVKMNDEVLSYDSLIGTRICQASEDSGVFYDEIVSTDKIDTSMYSGATVISEAVVIVHSADDLNAALGLPTGYITNGTYFVYVGGTDVVYTNRFTAPRRITKIDGKYLDLSDVNVDLSAYSTTSQVNTMIANAIGDAIGGSY